MVEVSFKYTWRAQPEGVAVVEERSSLTDRIVETRINTRDRAIVRALEVMGWASPDRHTQLVEALEKARDAIGSLPQDALGNVPDTHQRQGWHIRDELISEISTALAAHRKQGGEA